MASVKPIVRQVNYLYLAIHSVIIVLLAWIFVFSDVKLPFVSTLLTFGLLSAVLRCTVSKNQRKGMRLFNKGQYEGAIEEFQKSYSFFTKHSWIDKYRVIFVLSLSQISFKEMAMLNIALCYSQIGDGVKSKEYYEQVLYEFPDSEIAKSALRMFAAAKNIYASF